MLTGRDPDERDTVALEHVSHGAQVREWRCNHHTINTRLADVTREVFRERRRVVITRLHDDLIFRGTASFRGAGEHTRGVVTARNVIQQTEQVRAIAAESARGWVGVIVELLYRPCHPLADRRLDGFYVVDYT